MVHRVNTSLFAMCVVDAWLGYKFNQGSPSTLAPNYFYCSLAEALVDNTFMVPGTRSTNAHESPTEMTTSGIGPHLTPTSGKKKRSNDTATAHALQAWDKHCKNFKTDFTCYYCSREHSKDYWVSHSDTSSKWCTEHLQEKPRTVVISICHWSSFILSSTNDIFK